MKTLVIGDLHEKTSWCNRVIKEESPDLVIQLGDLFDSFITTKDTVKATCEWLIEFISKPNHIALMGNHCLFYRFPLVKHFVCSGNTLDKCIYINSILKHEHWEKLKLFHFDGTYLYSHAGISKEHFAHPINGTTLNGINEICNKAIECAKAGGAHPIVRAGWSRGGNEKHGGLLWQGWEEARPITGFHEIIGHTPHKSPENKDHIKYTPNKKNCLGSINCVDFGGKYYTLITDGKIEYKPTGTSGYNERENKLTGEPFIDTRKIIETKKIDDGEIRYKPTIELDKFRD